MITDLDIHRALMDFALKFRRDKHAAEALGVSSTMLSLMISKNKKIPERIANKLGFKKVWVKHETHRT